MGAEGLQQGRGLHDRVGDSMAEVVSLWLTTQSVPHTIKSVTEVICFISEKYVVQMISNGENYKEQR